MIRRTLVLGCSLWFSGAALAQSPPGAGGPMVPQIGSVSPSGSLTATPAAIINVIDPAYGAKGDGTTDDWTAIQKAEGMNSSGVCTYTLPTTVIIPPTVTNIYRVSQAIRRCPWVTLSVSSDATTILGTGNASGTDYTGATNLNQWPIFGLSLSGYVVASSTLPTLTLSGNASVGALTVTLATPAQASQLVANDVIDIETTQTFAIGGLTEPTNARMALVVSANVGTGVVTLDRPLDFAGAAILRRLTNGANTGGWPTLGTTGIPLFAAHHANIIGGRWVAGGATTQYQPFDGGGGCLDCQTKVDEVIAGYGIGYGNFFQGNTFSARTEQITTVGMELAYKSAGTTVDIGTLRMASALTSRPLTGWSVALDEGSHDNRVRIGRIEEYSPNIAEWLITGTPTGAGGDTINASTYVPAVIAASVNAAGTGYGTSVVGTMTWSGTGCAIAPVLSVSTTAGGLMSSVASIVKPGYCTVAPSSAATTWTAAGGLAAAGSGASFTMTTALSYTVVYTSVPSETLTTIATAVASAMNAVSGFTAAGYTATANTPGISGDVIVTNSTASTSFEMIGSANNSLVAYSPTHDVVKLVDAYRNVIDIGSVSGASITGYIAEVNGGTAAGEPATSDNDIHIASASLIYQNGHVSIGSAGSAFNKIHDGDFHGSVWQPNVFWLQFGAGSHNTLAHLSSDSPGGQPACSQLDMSNVLSNLYTRSSLSTTGNNGTSAVAAFDTCTFDRLNSDNINKFLSTRFEIGFFPTITSSTSGFFGTLTQAGGLELYESYHIVVRLFLSGVIGAKTGSFAFWGASTAFSFPSDATGVAKVTLDCDAYVYGTVRCISQVSSNSVTASAPTTSVSNSPWGSSLTAAVTLNVTTSTDTVQIIRVSGTPIVPTYGATLN